MKVELVPKNGDTKYLAMLNNCKTQEDLDLLEQKMNFIKSYMDKGAK
jgi:hypothetical protein